MEEKKSVFDVPMVRDFPDVFLDDLLSMPSERHLEFRIKLILGASPITKAPYHLGPPEMHELFSQLHKLLGKGFILLSSST